MQNNLFNNLFEKNNDFSLGKIILLFYILSSSPVLFNLLSKQWKKTLENDRIAQHLLGIMTLLCLVILVSDGKFSIYRIFSYTAIAYVWFIFSTKMDIQFNIIMFGSLVAFYLYQNTIENNSENIKEDKNLTDGEKMIIQKNNKNSYLYLTMIILALTLIGTLFYSSKKEIQYGGGYDLVNFLIY
jgi:hypothetical protein